MFRILINLHSLYLKDNKSLPILRRQQVRIPQPDSRILGLGVSMCKS